MSKQIAQQDIFVQQGQWYVYICLIIDYWLVSPFYNAPIPGAFRVRSLHAGGAFDAQWELWVLKIEVETRTLDNQSAWRAGILLYKIQYITLKHHKLE